MGEHIRSAIMVNGGCTAPDLHHRNPENVQRKNLNIYLTKGSASYAQEN
jgi:hypothetical protein